MTRTKLLAFILLFVGTSTGSSSALDARSYFEQDDDAILLVSTTGNWPACAQEYYSLDVIEPQHRDLVANRLAEEALVALKPVPLPRPRDIVRAAWKECPILLRGRADLSYTFGGNAPDWKAIILIDGEAETR